MSTDYIKLYASKTHFLVFIVVLLLIATGCTQTVAKEAAAAGDVAVNKVAPVSNKMLEEPHNDAASAAGQAAIEVTFKLDSRITGGVYMGDRWVSPPTYDTVQTGDTFILEAAAEVIGSDGRALPVVPEWTAEDPDLVTISPNQGREVKITVKGAGESSLELTTEGVSKMLYIEASIPKENAIRVAISQ